MNKRISDSIIGLCTLVVLILIPMYFLGLPVNRPVTMACRATSCSNTAMPNPDEHTVAKVEEEQLQPEESPTPALMAHVQQQYTQESVQPTGHVPEPTTTPVTEEKDNSQPPRQEDTNEQPSHNENPERDHQSEQGNNNQNNVVSQTLQPVQTVVSNVVSLLP